MLAQLVEQRTFNPFVVGSTPAHPTNTSKGLQHLNYCKPFLVLETIANLRSIFVRDDSSGY